jgi:hypothetical protein
METNIFSIMIDGQIVTGEIVRRTKDHVKIKIVSPYTNWSNDRYITGQGRMSPHHFLTVRGYEVAKELLINSYRKLQIIDESIDRICGLYGRLEEEKAEAGKLPDSKIKNRIISKVDDWFFHDTLFISSVTGLITAIDERERIIEIINAYRYEDRKIYME